VIEEVIEAAVRATLPSSELIPIRAAEHNLVLNAPPSCHQLKRASQPPTTQAGVVLPQAHPEQQVGWGQRAASDFLQFCSPPNELKQRGMSDKQGAPADPAYPGCAQQRMAGAKLFVLSRLQPLVPCGHRLDRVEHTALRHRANVWDSGPCGSGAVANPRREAVEAAGSRAPASRSVPTTAGYFDPALGVIAGSLIRQYSARTRAPVAAETPQQACHPDRQSLFHLVSISSEEAIAA